MHDSSPPAASRLQSLWLCEAIRRHEQHNPPLEDSEACRVARLQGRTDDERILLRNLALARREGLTGALQHWLAASRWLGLLLVALALLTGSALAVTAFNRTADSLMTPRKKIVWLDAAASYDDNLQTMHESAFSRFPVYRGNDQDVVGVLEVKSLLDRFGITRPDTG